MQTGFPHYKQKYKMKSPGAPGFSKDLFTRGDVITTSNPVGEPNLLGSADHYLRHFNFGAIFLSK